jgi:hypothetical protein
MLTGVTLALGVATWAFSPIKFQADMGMLLAFMFIVNMIGALVLLPALARFLLKPAAIAQAKGRTAACMVHDAARSASASLLSKIIT